MSPVGRALAEQLERRPRRQALAGFDETYSDIVDYVVRCTHRIWEQKNVGLIRTHYSPECVMHTLTGPARGLDAVVEGTIGALSGYTDRIVVAEDVIWSEDAPGLFLSSHRITSHATHMGDDPGVGGAATLAAAGVTTIADCLVRENRIIEEWLVRDNLLAARQIGRDPWELARAQATRDSAGNAERHRWRTEWIERVRGTRAPEVPDDHPGQLVVRAWKLALGDDLYGDASASYSPAAEIRWPSGRRGLGRGYWIGCLLQLRSALQDVRWLPDHVAARPLPRGDIAAAVRWSLVGRHCSGSVWGAPSDREMLIMGVTHCRLRGGVIVEEVTVFDELAVLRQTVGGLGA